MTGCRRRGEDQCWRITRARQWLRVNAPLGARVGVGGPGDSRQASGRHVWLRFDSLDSSYVSANRKKENYTEEADMAWFKLPAI